jgi:FkbM family methyltransferase
VHDNFFVNLIKTHCGDNDVVTVDPSQNPDILFYSVFGQSNGAYRARRRVFYAGEPVSHRTNADFNLTFDASNAINTRLPLWVCYFDHAILSPRQIPKREKFCSYIATNPRANRETFVEQLSSQYKRVDCGGKHLNNIGGAIPPGTNASGKIEHNKQYKFAIAFENTQYPGYVTEKICDVYKSGCIPIYWGTPDVVKDFNPSTFINANDFSDFDALIDHIRRVDCDDALYASYFKDPVLSNEWMQIFTDPSRAFFKQLVSDILHFNKMKTNVSEEILGLRFKYFINDCMASNSVGVKKKEWEPHITKFTQLYNSLFNIKNIIDIGANFGYHTLLFSQVCSENVYAFEPQSQSFKLLEDNLEINKIKNVILYNYACGDENCDIKMPVFINCNNTINMGDITPNMGVFSCSSITKSIILDQFNFSSKIDLIKLDVQGWEKKVLMGATTLLKIHKPVLI